MTEQTPAQIDFVMFVLYRLSEAWGMAVTRVYQLLASANIVDGYLIPCYDVLHTLGAEYLVEDVTDLARERGLAV